MNKEKEMTIRVDELMKEWATYIHSLDQWKKNDKNDEDAIFVEDGPFPYYWKQKPKILFIGRELYGKRNEGDPPTISYWNERECMEKLGIFQSRLLYLAYGILHGECDEETWEKMDTATKLNSIFATNKKEGFSYAFMNASKILNEKSTNVDDGPFGNFTVDKVNRAFFVREIELLAPDIIISGNLADKRFFTGFEGIIEADLNSAYRNENCSIWQLKTDQMEKAIPWLDGHHFSARGDTFEKFYAPICKVAKVLDGYKIKLN